jgi:UPF0716 protein FxsA
MTRFLILTAVLLPFLEIPGFILVSNWIGVIPMLVLVLGGVIAGIMVLQRVGINAVVSLRLAMAKGEEPGHTLINAACFALGGFLLTIPGFISDLIALTLFLPWTRNYLLRRMAKHFEMRHYVSPGFTAGFGTGFGPKDFKSGGFKSGGFEPGDRTPAQSGTVLEGEYSIVEENEPENTPETDPGNGPDSGQDSGDPPSLPAKRHSGNGL